MASNCSPPPLAVGSRREPHPRARTRKPDRALVVGVERVVDRQRRRGDGVIDAGETCDDADTDGLDCWVGCGLAAAGGTCELDASVCTSDVCDGAGTCTLRGPTTTC